MFCGRHKVHQETDIFIGITMLKPWRFHQLKESCRSRITFHGRTACHGFPYWLTSKDVAILSAVRLTLSLDSSLWLWMNYLFYLLELSSQDALPCFLRSFRTLHFSIESPALISLCAMPVFSMCIRCQIDWIRTMYLNQLICNLCKLV